MNNSFFILSKQEVIISRFHICTWDIKNANTFIELGIEFDFPKDVNSVDFKFFAPFAKKQNNIKCLLKNLITGNNSKFIFNDIIERNSPINEDDRHGSILDFKSRGKLAILPIENIMVKEDGIISFQVNKPEIDTEFKCYIRFLINTSYKTLSSKQNGINNTSFIYDIKLNERRNLPDNVVAATNNYKFCTIDSCFCFHVVPNSFNILFVDQNKMKNIRILEVEAFKNYLSIELKKIEENGYMILFNKQNKEDSYSFFTVFNKEIIGSHQITIAILINIFSGLLLGISSLRKSIDSSICFWKQIPVEYWILLILFLGTLYYLRPIIFNKK